MILFQPTNGEQTRHVSGPVHYYSPRVGIIIECPLNRQFHDHVIVIMSSRQIFIKNNLLAKIHYYHDKQVRNIKLTENKDLDITMTKNNNKQSVINGKPLVNFSN